MLKNVFMYILGSTDFDKHAGAGVLNSREIDSAECCGDCWGGGI
ncbi:MAG: hypothetical protein AB7G93_07525 [Bdellovibrionales bacterium]